MSKMFLYCVAETTKVSTFNSFLAAFQPQVPRSLVTATTFPGTTEVLRHTTAVVHVIFACGSGLDFAVSLFYTFFFKSMMISVGNNGVTINAVISFFSNG